MDAADDIRAISKKLFGSKYRLEAASYLSAVDGDVNASQLAAAIGTPRHNLAIAELRHFQEAGYVEALPRPQGQREQFYRRRPSRYWALCADFLEELRAA